MVADHPLLSSAGTDNEEQGEVTERTDSRFPLRHYSQRKKNVPGHILAPRRGCFGNHLPLRRVRILAERLLSYGNEVSYTTKKSIKGKRCGLSTALDTLFLMALIINKGKWLLVAFLPLWYNGQRYHPYTGTERGCATMSIFSSFLLSVLASVVAYYICKWLDGDK